MPLEGSPNSPGRRRCSGSRLSSPVAFFGRAVSRGVLVMGGSRVLFGEAAGMESV